MTPKRKLAIAVAVPAIVAAVLLPRLASFPGDAVAASSGGFAAAMRGRRLFVENCAQCHGEAAQGQENWHLPDAGGRYPAPPLDGTAHAWHHPRRQLEQMIAGGGVTMPPFADRLDAQQIADLITYLSSLWPDEIYEAWQRTNRGQARSQ